MLAKLLRYTMEELEQDVMGSFNFKIPSAEIFIMSLFTLHREIAHGEKVANLGSWLQQASEHMKSCGESWKKAYHTFHYDPKRPYDGEDLDYQTLTAWVMNPKFGDGLAIKTAQQWNRPVSELFDVLAFRTWYLMTGQELDPMFSE